MKINWNQFTDPMIVQGISLLGQITAMGHEAYVVGGTVRDIVMGKTKVNDLDIATNMPIFDIKSNFHTIEYGGGEKHGTVIVHYNGFDYELTQFRSDGTYSDNRRPDSVTFVSSFEEDCKRRDFTINAMGIDADGNVLDFHGGMEDIRDNRLRTVGNPYDRFGEDSLRILRAVRFAARFGFHIESETADAMFMLAPTVTNTSVERIGDEIKKMARDGRFSYAMLLMARSGLDRIVIGGITNTTETRNQVSILNSHDLGTILGMTVNLSTSVPHLKSSLALDNFSARRIDFISKNMHLLRDILFGADRVAAVAFVQDIDFNSLISVVSAVYGIGHSISERIDLMKRMTFISELGGEVSDILTEMSKKPGKEFGELRRKVMNVLYISFEKGKSPNVKSAINEVLSGSCDF